MAALGVPEFVKKEWLKPGATVIDVVRTLCVQEPPLPRGEGYCSVYFKRVCLHVMEQVEKSVLALRYQKESKRRFFDDLPLFL